MSALPAEIRMASGEGVPVPATLAEAIDKALALAIGSRNPDDWRTAFGTALVATLFDSGLFLVPRAHSGTREAVDANIYSMALSGKHAGERTLRALAVVVGAAPDRLDLVEEFGEVIAALTGHAPPAGTARLAGVDERLRQVRELVLGVPADAETQQMGGAA